jgi:hypothetical protein
LDNNFKEKPKNLEKYAKKTQPTPTSAPHPTLRKEARLDRGTQGTSKDVVELQRRFDDAW